MYIFRVDANEYIATGHLMRCMVIALELKSRGKDVLFCLAEDKFTSRLKANELTYIIMDSKWNELHNEIEQLKEIVNKYNGEWLIVDTYQADAKYLESLEEVTKVMYIDDLQKDIYNISAVLNYIDWLDDNSYFDKYNNLDTKLMVGMKYTPLRSEFFNGNDEVKNSIMITTGGTDSYNLTSKILLELLNKSELAQVKYNVVVGQLNENIEEIKRIAYDNRNVALHMDVDNMGELMRASDIAISAGGTTLLELCACGIPTVCFAFADNQIELTTQMDSHGIMICAGDVRTNEDICNDIGKSVVELFVNKGKRAIIKNNMLKLVDGKGTRRIVDVITNDI